MIRDFIKMAQERDLGRCLISKVNGLTGFKIKIGKNQKIFAKL